MTTIADLYFTFNQNRYRGDPEVREVRPADLALANVVLTTHRNRLQIALQHWNQLYLSIPPEWRVVIQSGNQDFKEGEFFATVLTVRAELFKGGISRSKKKLRRHDTSCPGHSEE